MWPVALLLGGIDAYMKYQGNKSMNQSIQNAQDNARQQFKVSTAGRSDAYGNRYYYDALTNEWKTKLSPTQERITKAGEAEQLRSLTEDAMRNREIKKRQFRLGRQALEDYAHTRAAYRYGGPKDETAIRDELGRLLTAQAAGNARKSNAPAIRQAIRSGSGGGVIQNLTDAAYNDLGAELPGILLNARTGAMGESGTRQSNHQSRYLPELQRLEAMLGKGGDAPTRFSDTPEAIRKSQDANMELVMKALNQGAVNSQRSEIAGAKLLNDGLDLKSLATLISATSGKGGKSGGSGGISPNDISKANDISSIFGGF